ncbi:MAG: hypothetical protein HOV84_10335 [Streptomyces sp.]|nr:hypothetical protein [Streptomyces sp.]
MSLVLTTPPSLPPLLARGALLSLFKRPAPDAEFPRTRLVLGNLRVDLARLAAYERVCGFPTGEDALPVTYPHVLGFPLAMRLMSGRDFPLPLLGLVHTSITITQHRAVTATGEYELSVYIDGLAPHRRGTEAAVITEMRVGDEVVWESRSTYLARHRTRQQASATAEAVAAAEAVPGEKEAARAGKGAEGAEVAEGASKPLPEVAEWRIAEDVGRRYGAASGDRNPIHLHPLTARLFGFPRAIAHGMWTVARCLAAHGVPARARVEAEFRAPVLLPATVTYAAEGGRFELRGGSAQRLHLAGRVQPLV